MNPKEKQVTLPMDIFIRVYGILNAFEGMIRDMTGDQYDSLFKEIEQTMEAAFRAAKEE